MGILTPLVVVETLGTISGRKLGYAVWLGRTILWQCRNHLVRDPAHCDRARLGTPPGQG